MKKQALLLLATVGLLNASSFAALTLYTDPAAFDATLASSSSLGFTAPAGGVVNVGPTPKFTLSPSTSLTFSSSDSSFSNFNTVSNLYDGYKVYKAPVLIASTLDFSKPITLTITSSDAINAMSFDAGSINGATFTLTTSNGDTYSKLLPGNASTTGATAFSGFVSSKAFTSVTVSTTAANELFILQDLKVGSTVPVPEPSSLAFLGLGLAGLVVYGVRNRRSLLSASR